jgi:hypothetical protein
MSDFNVVSTAAISGVVSHAGDYSDVKVVRP